MGVFLLFYLKISTFNDNLVSPNFTVITVIRKKMQILRSVIFNICYTAWNIIYPLVCMVFMPLPQRFMLLASRGWGKSLVFILRITTGIKMEVRGLENVPKGAAIIASKHQSAFETIAFHAILKNAIYILKRPLFWIPPVGWCMWKSGCIGINRSAGASALRYMTKEALKKLNEGKKLIIFPEGTRTPVGSKKPYQPGIAMLYAKSDAPIIPVALNSGMCWKRNAFSKTKGTITIEFLPAIKPGMNKKEFMQTLQETIETASQNI